MLKYERFFWRVIDGLLAVLLVSMFVMVLTNVVLRYLFHSGIAWSEELSRFAFVWLTFIGAASVARSNGHLNVETLVAAVPPRVQKLMLVVCDLIIVGCCALLVDGTLRQWNLNATNHAPITGLSYAWVFGVGLFSGFIIALLSILRLFRTLTNRLGPTELAAFAGKYEDEDAARLKRLSE